MKTYKIDSITIEVCGPSEARVHTTDLLAREIDMEYFQDNKEWAEKKQQLEQAVITASNACHDWLIENDDGSGVEADCPPRLAYTLMVAEEALEAHKEQERIRYFRDMKNECGEFIREC